MHDFKIILEFEFALNHVVSHYFLELFQYLYSNTFKV
jgi:hypothetical protein